MRLSLSVFSLAGALLTTAAYAQTGSSLEIRQRVLTLADQTQIHLLEAGRPASAPRSCIHSRLDTSRLAVESADQEVFQRSAGYRRGPTVSRRLFKD